MRAGPDAELTFEVGQGDTARALGSGDLEVLGTPRLLAWLEAATCAAVREELDSGRTTVGTGVTVSHLAASPVGSSVVVHARLVDVDGRRLRFEVAARDAASGDPVAGGTITRAVVDVERFLARMRG